MAKKKFLFWRKTSGNLVEDNFSDKPEYHAFFARCNKEFEFRIANDPEAYLGNGVFKNVFSYSNWKFIHAEETFKPDVVYQRKKLTEESFDKGVPIINTPEFKKWSPDKLGQYELLKEYMPRTFLIEKEQDLDARLAEISTPKAVLKPRRGEKGENVVIFEKSAVPRLNNEILEKRGYVLQEYADTNVSVPNVVEGVHDIKLITIGDKVFANLRTPEINKDYCTLVLTPIPSPSAATSYGAGFLYDGTQHQFLGESVMKI